MAARRWSDLSLIMHLNASTPVGDEPDEKYLVCSVEEALRSGADMVSVHVNLGARTEAAAAAGPGHRGRRVRPVEPAAAWPWSIRAARRPNPCDPALVAHAVTVAAELGADVVKTVQVVDGAGTR